MMSRVVNFHVDAEELPTVMSGILTEVLPQFKQLSCFMGLTVLKSEATKRSEVIATSFWDDGLEDSETVSRQFAHDIYRATGSNPSRKPCEFLFCEVRESDGTFHAR